MVDDNVAGLTRGLRPHDALDRDDLAHVRLLGLEGVQRQVGVVIVRVSLQKVLSLRSCRGIDGALDRTQDRKTSFRRPLVEDISSKKASAADARAFKISK